MRRTLIIGATLLTAAALCGVGIAAVPHGTQSDDLGGFGGALHGAHPVAIWHESGTATSGVLHRVPCATSGRGDISRCYAP